MLKKFFAGLTTLEIFVVSFSLFLTAVAIFTSKVDRSSYEAVFAVEDGGIEWMTVFALLSGAFLCFQRVAKLATRKSMLFLTLTAALGGLFVFGAGEEISWGQRIFKHESSEYFRHNNSQGETNVHNLIVDGVKINKLIFGTLLGIMVAVYFLIVPLLYAKSEKYRRLINQLACPVPRLFHVIAYLVLFILVSLISSPKRGEMLELGGTFMFFLLVWRPQNEDQFN